MRGGISFILKRYRSIRDNNTIMYWDANDLYDCAMIQSLPVSDFKFLSEKETNRFDLNSISENSEIGYILEKISSHMLSRYCSDIANNHEIKVGGVKKLIPNRSNKVKYVVHYRNLEYYLSLGIKLIKVHRILIG